MDAKNLKKEELDFSKIDEITDDKLKEDIQEKVVEEVIDEPVVEEKKTVEKQEPEKEETQEEIDYREKFKASSKEALRLREENQKLLEEKERLAEKKDVTLEELKSQYSDWDDMTEKEQSLAKKDANNELRIQALEARNQMYLNEKKLSREIGDQIELWEATSQYKDIVAHKEEFRRYCKQDGNKGLDLEKLAKLFLYELPPEKQIKGNTPMAVSKNKAQEEPKKGISVEDSASLRKNNPREWQRLIKEGAFRTKI